jgi:ATP sulfurylase
VEEYDCDGIFIHPINGLKKPGDFTDDMILQAYQSLVEKHYPSNLAVIGTFGTYPRYAGPREALFTALCRKNFGCSHFIVGRDHTGVGAFYASDGARRLFDATGDIGIQPTFFEEVYYCSKCAAHLEWCEHGKTFVHRISGTEMRESLIQDKMLPNWYVRESVSRTILEAIEKQQEVFYPSPLSGLT